MLFQWQALEKEEFNSAISQWGTDGLNRDSTLKHSYPDDKWVLVSWVIGTGNGTRPGVATLPRSRNCSRVCWCYPLTPDFCGVTQWFGCATKNRSAPSRRNHPLRTLSSDADGPTWASYGSHYIISRASRTSVRTT